MNKFQLLLSLTLIISTYEGHWVSAVTGYNIDDPKNGYAGIIGKGVSLVRMNGGKSYRVHVKGGSWLSPVTGNNRNNAENGYAGIKGRVIDAVAISGGVTYRVHVLGGGWLPPVNGYNTGDSNNGYAGNLGQTIDAISIQGRSYAVYYENSVTPSGSCNFINYGTGISTIDYQWKIPNMETGCFFMAMCVKGGLCTNDQITKAYYWALSEGKINSNCYINSSGDVLAQQISQKYGTTFHSDYKAVEGPSHFWLVNSNGDEIFNASGLGYHK